MLGPKTKTFVEMANSRSGFWKRKGWGHNSRQLLLNETMVMIILGTNPEIEPCQFLTEEDIEADDWFEVFIGG